jgi:transposase
MNLHNEIKKMAYELYQKRGKAEGHDLDDWFEAERIIVAQHRVEEKLEAESSSPPKKKKESRTKGGVRKTETKK